MATDTCQFEQRLPLTQSLVLGTTGQFGCSNLKHMPSCR